MAENFGGEFKLHDGTNLVELDGVLAITPSAPSRGTYKTTDHATTGGVHTYRGEPLREPGTLSVRIKYSSGSATDLLLLAAEADPAPRSYEVTFPGPSGRRKMTGSAILTEYAVQEMGLEGQQEAVLSFQASGARTDAAVSS